MEDWSTVDFEPPRKIGNWFVPDTLNGKYVLDTNAIVHELVAKLTGIEEEFITEFVVKSLRAKGYTVIEPGVE